MRIFVGGVLSRPGCGGCGLADCVVLLGWFYTRLVGKPGHRHPELEVLPQWPQQTIGVLVTTDPAPHAIPVSWPVRATDRRILLSLRANRGSLTRLKRQPMVALLILGADNTAFCARGTARVLTPQMERDADYAAVAVDVDVIDDHRQEAFKVIAGVQREVIDDGELRGLQARFAELSATVAED